LKRQIKELQRKEANLKEFKEKFDSMKQAEKTIIEEKNQALEKLKTLKAEITRKESNIKDLKDKLDLVSLQADSNKLTDDDVGKSKEAVRKLKLELDRKDQTIKSLKSKLDTVLVEIDHVKTENLSRSQSTSQDLDREVKRHDQTKMQLKRLETQFSNLVFILRRLFRDTFSIVQKLRQKFAKNLSLTQQQQGKSFSISNLNKFADSIDILNLTPEEIQMFVDAPSKQASLDPSFAQQKLIEKFEDELSNTDSLNPTQIYDMLNTVIEERVTLEKKSG